MEGQIIKELDKKVLPEEEKTRILDMRDERDAIIARLAVANKKDTPGLEKRLKEIRAIENKTEKMDLPIIAEKLDKHQKKMLKKRARKKVFGRVGTVCERAFRTYKEIDGTDPSSSDNKMQFFYEEMKNNFWFGLLSKTSKIAPRHVRLTLMYEYIAWHLLFVTAIYVYGF